MKNVRLITLKNIYNQGVKDVPSLSKLSGLSTRQVFRLMPKLRRGLSLKRKPGSGRRSKLSPNDKRRIIQLARNNDYRTSQDIANEIITRGSPEVSSSTIRRTLNQAGYFKYVPKPAPMLTRKMKTKRIEWAKRHLNTNWNNWVFSDESKFQLYRCGIQRWGKKRPLSGRPKYCPYVMVWGANSVRGKSRLVIIEGTVDSPKYCQILEEALPDIKELHRRGYIFQQDNAPCHTAKNTKKWFEATDIKVSDWPAGSPDLNPIEAVWKLMKDIVEKQRPKTITELKAIISKVWENFNQDLIKSLIYSMPRRLEKCIEVQGEVTGY